MLDDKTLVEVQNRDNGSVGYKIPDLNNLRRIFSPGEVKKLTLEELRKLSWIPGGEAILRNHLSIKNEEVIAELLGEVEPEYRYTSEDVKALLLNGSLDELKDCLDFAPTGVIELVKTYAVDLEINDIAKRRAITEATGFNIDVMIENKHAFDEEDTPTEEPKKERRVNKTTTTTRTRRTVVPKTSVEE